jgi:signal peptidase I
VTTVARIPGPVRFAAGAALWAAIAAAAAIGLALALPNVAGWHSFTVLSGSMEPAIHTGDIVMVRPVSPAELRVGDVVTFKDPADRARLITHRLSSFRARSGSFEMVTRGDANNTPERWSVPASGRLGRVAYRVPYAGYLLAQLGGRYGRILLIALPALLLAAYEVARIWRPVRWRGATGETAA